MTLFERFKSPTPKKWVHLGNSLLAVSSTVSGFSAYSGLPFVAVVSIGCGIVGKFLTTFFVEDNSSE